jgi:hypothetical protein
MVLQWDRIGAFEYRAKISGGWLVKYLEAWNETGAGGLTFVPDPRHEWVEEVYDPEGQQKTKEEKMEAFDVKMRKGFSKIRKDQN